MLENRNDLLESKKSELVSVIDETRTVLGMNCISSNDILSNLIECGGLKLTAPQEEPFVMQMITINSLRDFNKAQSIKPGNIKLNIRCIVEQVTELVANAVGLVMDINILKVCAALNLWKMFRNVATVEVTKEQAMTIVALWDNCDRNQRITLEQGFECAKSFYLQIEKKEYTWEKYIKLVEELEKIESIKVSDKGIWLCEWVSINYIR